MNKGRFIQLGWTILEAKAVYYLGLSGPKLSDEEYDEYEAEYKQLSKKLNEKPTACSYVGFPDSKPCGKLVLDKMRIKNGKIQAGWNYTIKEL